MSVNASGDVMMLNCPTSSFHVNGFHRGTLIETFYVRIISFSHAQLKHFNFLALNSDFEPSSSQLRTDTPARTHTQTVMNASRKQTTHT